jgi:CheY-like chemotaxis protein
VIDAPSRPGAPLGAPHFTTSACYNFRPRLSRAAEPPSLYGLVSPSPLAAPFSSRKFGGGLAPLPPRAVPVRWAANYDIIILDLLLPDMDGYEVLRRLRAARVRTPVLILSGLDALNDKLKGLGFGADDFLTKPFDHRELVARVQAIVRRSKGHAESTIRTGKLLVNLDSRVVSVGDQPLHVRNTASSSS